MRGKPFRRLFGAALSLVYFSANSALASAPETLFWTQRRQAVKERRTPSSGWLASLPLAVGAGASPEFEIRTKLQSPLARIPQEIAKTLPASFFKENAALLTALSSSQGTIRRIKMPPGLVPTKLILHVQDVHLNADAQSNISALVTSVTGQRAVDLVGLEGAFGRMDFSRYRAYPHRKIIREVARALLEKGDISGPIHAALSADPEPPATIGVDDVVHYRANVNAYRMAAPLQPMTIRRLEEEQREISLRKTQIFSDALRRFDEKATAYQEGRTSLGEHLHDLADILPIRSPAITDFLATWTLEKNIDFNRAEVDRREWVDQLVATLDQNSLDSLSAAAMACRAGTLTYAEFYRQMSALSQKAGVSINRFPALAGYVQYLFAADRILPDDLFHEMRMAEDAAYACLARTPAEKKMVADSRRLHLTKKLAAFSLTPEEWAEWKERREAAMAPFEDFYQEAQIRDDSMTRNFLNAMEKNHAKTALLVTGGFHSAGMEEEFLKAGAAVISFTPRIDKIDTVQGSAYLSVFTREKTPLDRMFQGRALFLTPPIFSPEVEKGKGPLLAAALEASQAAREAAEKTVMTTFKSLSTAPGAEEVRITAIRLPGDQVGVTAEMNGETTTLWVTLSPGNDRILAYNTVRPGEERTMERAERLFKGWSDRAFGHGVHLFAGVAEWNFLSPQFVVQHRPVTPAEWVQQIQNRRWLIFGSAFFLAASILFALALSSWVFAGPGLARALYSCGAAVPFAFLAKVVWHVLIDEYRRDRGEATATKRARPPPLTKSLVSAVNDLESKGLSPRVNGRRLSEMVGNPAALLDHLHRYCVIRSPAAILRILEDRVSLTNDLASMTENQIKSLDLYEGVFEQESYLGRNFSDKRPLRVVMFRGGRAAASLTHLLSRDPRIRVNAIVAGTDAGRGHRIPAYDFDTPGVPDMGKALLDLAQSEPMKDFLGSRFQSSNGEYNDLSEEEYMKDFEGLTEYLINRETARTSPNLDKWIKKVETFSKEDRKIIGLFFASFLRILKTIHSNQVIGDPQRDFSLPPFRFNNYPLRSIALQGAVWANFEEGWPDPWQRSVIALAKLLKLRQEDAVRIATANPQNLMAMATDGTVYFGETGLNEYPGTAEVITLWMVNRFPLLKELISDFTEETGLRLEPPTKEELEEKGVNPAVHEEIIATVRRLPPAQATIENIRVMERYFRYLSRSVRGALNPVVVHHRTAEKITEADVILYGPGTQESNVISSMLARKIGEAIAGNGKAVKIYFVNPTKENRKLHSTSATLLRSFYRPLSRPREMFSRVRWTRVADYVDYAVGRSDEFTGLDQEKEYIPHNPLLIQRETFGRVVGVAIDLESKIPRPREGVDYQQRPPEFGFFHDSLTKEAVIALYALKTAGKQLTRKGDVADRKGIVRPSRTTPFHVRHMGMLRRRMNEMGIPRDQQDALLAEMNDFTVKSQQWYYARLMRLLDFPIQLWLPECQNAEWTEMTSRMVELLNAVTEVISLDYDDTLEKRNTDLSRVNALRLARRVAAGQKIAFNTAKTPGEMRTVENAETGKPGVEMYAPLRQALVDVLQAEREDLSRERAENAADDLLHDLFFLYMNSGAALARPIVRGIGQAVDLPLDPYFTIVYPPELKEKITQILNDAFGPKSLGDALRSMVFKFFYGPPLRLMKMIVQPFGGDETEKSERAPIADQINRLFDQYNIQAHVNPAGKTSIDVNPYLPGGEVLEKRRAIQHLFNQGHRVVTFIDNEIYRGNATSVQDMVVELAAHPEKNEGRILRVIAVDPGLSQDNFRTSLGLAGTIVRRLPNFALAHPEIYRPRNTSEIVLMNGLSETAATAAFLRNAPYGIKKARVNVPDGKESYEAVLIMSPKGWVKKLFRLRMQGRQRSFRVEGRWDARISLIDQVTHFLDELRQDAHTLGGDIQSLRVEVPSGFVLPEPSDFAAQVEARINARVVFSFPSNKRGSGPVQPSRPFSIREQQYKAMAHAAFAFTGAALTIGHITLGLGTAWALPVAVLTTAVFFRYAWRATLARNEHARLLAKASQWDPNSNQNESAQSLAAIQTQFQRFGFTPTPTGLSSFKVAIKGKQVIVRFPTGSTELSNLLSRDRLAETQLKGETYEIVIAPGIDPALLPAVVLTEIHRVSPFSALAAYFRLQKWFSPRVRETLTLLGESPRGRPQKGGTPSPNKAALAPAPLTNSPIYLLTRDVRLALAGVLFLEMPLLIFLGSVSPAIFLAIFSSIHVIIEAWQNPGRPWWKHVLSFFIHLLVASPYAFIGVPGDAMTIVAGVVHLVYDGVLMRVDQARLARQDMRSFGVPLPTEPRRPLLDLLMPPLESLDINGLDGQSVRMARVSQRMTAGGSYAGEWAGQVDTLVSFHQVLIEDLPVLRTFIENRPDQENGRFQILLAPGANDPSLEKALEKLAGKNVTVIKHAFEPSGEVKIDAPDFQSWTQGKGAIAWITTKNPRSAPILPDPHLPLLARLLKLLEVAPPLTSANLEAVGTFARALLTAA